jgi:AraC-like DNA-binding protein
MEAICLIAGAHGARRAARPSDGRVLSSAADGIAEFIAANGADAKAVLRAAGIDERVMRNGRESLDLQRYCALIELAARQTSNSNFGLHYGSAFMPERLGLIGEIALASPTLGSSLHNLTRFFPYHQQNTATAFRKIGDLWHLEYRILDGRILSRRQDAELTMGTYLNVIRRCLGKHWAPAEVYFEHPCPMDVRSHERLFKAPVHFNMKTNALVFHDHGLAQPMPGWHATRVRDLSAALVELTGHTGTLNLTDQVVGEIRAHLPAGYPHIEDVAEALQMTRWTLQRRLADQGEVFSDLVETTRMQLAEAHLGEPHMAIRDIADILGYSELSAFSRACVRWFKAPPSKVRLRLLKAAA